MSYVITLDEYLGENRIRYPRDLTVDIENNAIILLEKVNLLIEEIPSWVWEFHGINSGWRPRTYNDRIPNAAKNSKHITGQAIDLDDDDGSLDEYLFELETLLEFADLYLEHPSATKGWCHLQTVPPKSRNRVFYP